MDVEGHSADGVIGIVDLLAKGQAHPALIQLIRDRPRVRYRAGEAIQFGRHQCFAGAHGCQRLGKPGAVTVATGQAVVNVNAVLGHAEFDQRAALSGEILLVGRAAGKPEL